MGTNEPHKDGIATLAVATDLSAAGDRALERAVALAAAHDARLVVIYAVDPALPDRIAASLRRDAERLIRERMAALADAEALDVSIWIDAGKPHRVTIEAADDANADLVVLGRHAQRGALDVFRNSTAERVIRLGHRPILLAQGVPTEGYRRILAGVDFSLHSRHGVAFAARLLPGAELTLVHACHRAGHQDIDALKRQAASELAALPEAARASHRRAVEGDTRAVLRDEIHRHTPDLLVIGTHGRVGVAHALLGSVAEDLLRDPPCDVLAVKAW